MPTHYKTTCNIFFFIIASILLTGCKDSSSPNQTPLSRAEVISILVSDVIGPDTISTRTVAYLTQHPLKAGDRLRTPVAEKDLYTLKEETWFSWIDDAPTALYEHPVRFVFVNPKSREISIDIQGWYPVLNDSIALFKNPATYPYAEHVIWSNVPESEY